MYENICFSSINYSFHLGLTYYKHINDKKINCKIKVNQHIKPTKRNTHKDSVNLVRKSVKNVDLYAEKKG